MNKQATTTIKTYKGFMIVKNTKRPTVDLINPVGKFRVVKSEQAAKWRITRALNVARTSGLI